METLEIIVDDHKYEFDYVTEQMNIPHPVYVFYFKPKKKSKLEFVFPRFFMVGNILEDNTIEIYYNEYNKEKTVLKEEIKKKLQTMFKEETIILMGRKKKAKKPV